MIEHRAPNRAEWDPIWTALYSTLLYLIFLKVIRQSHGRDFVAVEGENCHLGLKDDGFLLYLTSIGIFVNRFFLAATSANDGHWLSIGT